MIKIKGTEIALEGDFETLIKEAALAAHSICKAVGNRFTEETDGKVDYDHIVELILEELSQLKRFDNQNLDLDDELKLDFDRQLKIERENNGSTASFIDFDTDRLNFKDSDKIIQNVIKDVFISENKKPKKKKKK
jgi:hypothetical protein